MTPRQRLRDLLVSRSVKLGSFTLASGQRSSYYIDARLTTMCAEGQHLVGLVCWDVLREAGWSPTHVGGLTLGADPIAYALAHRSWLEETPVDGFTVRKSPKGHGTGQLIEGGLPTDARVVILEDSLTSGGSALRAVDAVEGHGAEVLGILALVDRNEGARKRIEDEGYGLAVAFEARELLERARAGVG